MAESMVTDSSSSASLEGALMDSGNIRRNEDMTNFKFSPPRSAHWKMIRRRSKYHTHMAAISTSRDRLAKLGYGSSSNLNLDPAKMMTLQEDARSRKISTEVMKSKLYESVLASPRRRRMSVSVRSDYCNPAGDAGDMYGGWNPVRMAVSLPVTPAHSEHVTPNHSPKSERKRFHWGFFSRGATPDEENKQFAELVESGSQLGLASFLKPLPRCLPANRSSQNIPQDMLGLGGLTDEAEEDEEEEDMIVDS